MSRTWFNGWFRLRYDEDKENRSETRNSLLVVSTLITAVTFQAGVNPPGGIWQENKDGHKAGRAIYADQKEWFYVFLIFNTIALSTSIQLLMSLTWRFPYQLEVWLSTVSMPVTYSSSIFAIAPDESVKFRYLLLSALVPLGLRVLIKISKFFKTNKIPDQVLADG